MPSRTPAARANARCQCCELRDDVDVEVHARRAHRDRRIAATLQLGERVDLEGEVGVGHLAVLAAAAPGSLMRTPDEGARRTSLGTSTHGRRRGSPAETTSRSRLPAPGAPAARPGSAPRCAWRARRLVLELLLEDMPRRKDLADRLALDAAARDGGDGDRRGGAAAGAAEPQSRRSRSGSRRKRRRCSRGGFRGQRSDRRGQGSRRRGRLGGRGFTASSAGRARALLGRTVGSSNAGLLACTSSHGSFYEHALGQRLPEAVAQFFSSVSASGGETTSFRWTKDDPVDGCQTQLTPGPPRLSDASETGAARVLSSPWWSAWRPPWSRVTFLRTISSTPACRLFSRSRIPSNALRVD